MSKGCKGVICGPRLLGLAALDSWGKYSTQDATAVKHGWHKVS